MPDRRVHRGPNPEDALIFAPAKIPDLQTAVGDFSLLLTKGYAEKGALKLVGDRFSLTKRQRLACMRCACSDKQLASRKQKQIEISNVTDRDFALDGYNVLITIEAAMSGGVIFIGRDGCLRDLASVHGTYRKVQETIPAVELIGQFLETAGVKTAEWLFDSPVSNSGRLKTLVGRVAQKHNWNWQVRLLLNPDTELSRTASVVASSDGVVLDNCALWVNLTREIIEKRITDATVINLSGS